MDYTPEVNHKKSKLTVKMMRDLTDKEREANIEPEVCHVQIKLY